MTDLTPCPWPIEELLPHAHPMIFIDRVTGYGDDRIEAEVIVWDDHPMLERAKGLPTWTLIEHMAQTVAALAGIRAKSKGEKVRVGFLLGSRKVELAKSHVRPGSCLVIKGVEVLVQDNMGVYDCECLDRAGQSLAKARLNVYLPDDLSNFMD